jgi:hypothetical protein
MNLLAQPVRGSAQNQDARSQPTGQPADKEVLRGYVERMVEEKQAGQRKQTPRKTRPQRGGQGAGAKRELAQLQKDAAASQQCEHCGKKHAGECWYKPGSQNINRAEKKAALKAAASSLRRRAGRMQVLRWKKAMTTILVFLSVTPLLTHPPHMHGPSSRSLYCTPHPQCVPRHTGGGLCHQQTRARIVRKHPRSAKLQGLLGKPQVGQYADLVFRLKTDKG